MVPLAVVVKIHLNVVRGSTIVHCSNKILHRKRGASIKSAWLKISGLGDIWEAEIPLRTTSGFWLTFQFWMLGNDEDTRDWDKPGVGDPTSHRRQVGDGGQTG
ncbi:hypothetical protein GJ744_010528 [Endocarpon pusillum]|uniref:Uncharacterized protein n=1 Tax=Endocarpon pusillum TaxID=364733 RepID=A0A8H7E8G6_9EURO|nr:hypothetical protein GJ744_010528 [Endocarpon pusillum]